MDADAARLLHGVALHLSPAGRAEWQSTPGVVVSVFWPKLFDASAVLLRQLVSVC